MASKEEMEAIGIKLYQCLECCSMITEEESRKYNGYCKKCYNEKNNIKDENRQYNQNENNYYESRKIENKVANKFKIVANILKFLGYGGAILCAIVIMANGESGAGILGGIVIAIATWFGCLFWEAVAEGLQLLEDIKNK